MEGMALLVGKDAAHWMAVAGKIVMYAGKGILTILLPICSIYNFHLGFSLGQAQVCVTIPGELMPAKHRTFGLGLLNFIHGFTIFGTLQAQTYIEINAGLQSVFLISSVCTAASALIVAKFVPETKGKTLMEIEEYYKQFSKTRSDSDISLSSNSSGDNIPI